MAKKKKPFVVDDSTDNDLIYDPVIDGEKKSRGLIKRDYSVQPLTVFAPPSEIPMIDESEWDARYDEQEKRQSSLEHLWLRGDNGKPILNLDQNGHGYCWSYSTGHAVMTVRLINKPGEPIVRLNPHSVASIIKKGKDEGGWSGLSAQFVRDHGMASEQHWKVHSRDTSQDTPACREHMKEFRITEDFVDLSRSVYDQNLTKQQIASCLLQNVPVMVDYNEWGHAICAMRWVRVERGVWAPRILNSWRGWGDNGFGTINKSWNVDGAVAVRVVGRAA